MTHLSCSFNGFPEIGVKARSEQQLQDALLETHEPETLRFMGPGGEHREAFQAIRPEGTILCSRLRF